MELYPWIALIVLALVGYSAYRSYQDRALTKRLKQMRDKDSILGEIDAAIEKSAFCKFARQGQPRPALEQHIQH